jgi:hypothetical protein
MRLSENGLDANRPWTGFSGINVRNRKAEGGRPRRVNAAMPFSGFMMGKIAEIQSSPAVFSQSL